MTASVSGQNGLQNTSIQELQTRLAQMPQDLNELMGIQGQETQQYRQEAGNLLHEVAKEEQKLSQLNRNKPEASAIASQVRSLDSAANNTAQDVSNQSAVIAASAREVESRRNETREQQAALEESSLSRLAKKAYSMATIDNAKSFAIGTLIGIAGTAAVFFYLKRSEKRLDNVPLDTFKKMKLILDEVTRYLKSQKKYVGFTGFMMLIQKKYPKMDFKDIDFDKIRSEIDAIVQNHSG